MNQHRVKVVLVTITGLLLPILSHAQGVSGEIRYMQEVLDQLYEEMLPLCYELISIGQGIAGFAALWYIASRVWRHIANAEPIDFYPLLRPFAIGLAIMMFPAVLDVMNAVLQPTVTGTAALVKNSNTAIAYLLIEKEKSLQKVNTLGSPGAVQGADSKWFMYENPEDAADDPDLLSNGFKFLMAKTSHGMKTMIKEWLSQILEIVFEAAALCINTLRTFYLIVLAILGPLVFGLAVFDGLQHSLVAWIARYINVFLWLPVANIFGSIIGKIQENMLKTDLVQIELYGDTFFSSSDAAYIVFLIIGILGYFAVPSVAGYIVHAGGSNALLHKATNLFAGTVRTTTGAATTGASAMTGAGVADTSRQGGNTNQFRHDQLSGKKS